MAVDLCQMQIINPTFLSELLAIAKIINRSYWGGVGGERGYTHFGIDRRYPSRGELMRYLRNGFYLGILLLTLLAACGPPNLKPSPLPIVNQTLVPGPISLVPVCVPPPFTTIANSFCANPGAGLGGAKISFNYTPSSSHNQFSIAPPQANCTEMPAQAGTDSLVCSGPKSGQFELVACSECDAFGSNNTSAFACAEGYKLDQNNTCVPIDPNQKSFFCPPGSHFDNSLQICSDNVSGKSIPICPAGFEIFDPIHQKCFQPTAPIVTNCQTINATFGDCPVKKIPGTGSQCPPGQTYTCDPLVPSKCSCK
jgi:hypothetical protein